MVLDNFVKPERGIPVRLHLTDHRFVTIMAEDPLLHIVKPLPTLVFTVDEQDGRQVAKTWSITSAKLADKFAGVLPDKSYRESDWIVVKSGEQHQTQYSLQRIPRG